MTAIDDVNDNKQKILAMKELKSNEKRNVWIIECINEDCGHVYRTNGGEFYERKCPKCQGGAPGL